MSALPETARIVVIGGGVGGTSVAYHLAERGERDVLLIERAELTSGSTFHSAGLVGQLRADPTLTRMNMYSVELYQRLQGGEHPVGWVASGGIKLASSPERLAEIRRQIGWAATFGLDLTEISAAQAQDLFPLIDTTGVLGAAYLASDGYLDPSQLCYSLAAGARGMGVRISTHTRVTGIDVEHGRVRRVRTDQGDVDCEVVVDCGGMFAAQIGRMAGVRVPVVPMSHQYLITEALPQTAAGSAASGARTVLPALRDPDLLVYWRPEVDGLLMGGYERNPEPWTASSTAFDAVPADFNGKLLPPVWDRFEQIAANAARRVPVMADLGVRRIINGPEAFTPDNEFCLGESEVGGFFVAAGFCAHGIAGAGGIGQLMASWILDGDPGRDVWHMDVRRFGAHYASPSYTLARTVETYSTYYDIPYPNAERQSGRPLRTSPAYPWHAAHGAVFGEKAGWERVNYYESNAAAGDPALRPHGWAGRNWSPAIEVEHRATRESAALFDESSFAKIEITGPDAAAFLERVCDNTVAGKDGKVTYTQLLNDRGGIEADVTVTRWDAQTFWLVTGTAFGTHDLSWLRRQARAGGERVALSEITGQYCCFALWGPRSREILSRLTAADVSADGFRFMTARALTVADVPARALRVTFTGELGWELYAGAEYGAGLWNALWDAGQDLGLVAAGYRAIDSLRLEKGYRVWSTDLSPETTPDEAGLGFCVRLSKPGGFVGAEAIAAARMAAAQTGESPGRRLTCLTLADPLAVVLGREPVRAGGQVAGRVTSGGYGYTVGRSIAYAYLPADLAAPGTPVQVGLFGEWMDAEVSAEPLYDPSGTRLRS